MWEQELHNGEDGGHHYLKSASAVFMFPVQVLLFSFLSSMIYPFRTRMKFTFASLLPFLTIRVCSSFSDVRNRTYFSTSASRIYFLSMVAVRIVRRSTPRNIGSSELLKWKWFEYHRTLALHHIFHLSVTFALSIVHWFDWSGSLARTVSAEFPDWSLVTQKGCSLGPQRKTQFPCSKSAKHP